MKLTRTDRDAFVQAVMDDVPQIDYEEEMAKVARNADYQMMPPKIREVWDDPELRGFLNARHIYHYESGLSVGLVMGRDAFNVEGVEAEIMRLSNLSYEQKVKRNEMREQVRAMIAGCHTLKQAKTRLPEFEKYLPEDRDSTGVSGLPAIANVVTCLTEMGWPKDLQKAA